MMTVVVHARIEAVALGQGGLISRQQLGSLGVGRNRISTLVGHKKLDHVTRNVYEVRAGPRLDRERKDDPWEWARVRSAWIGLLSHKTGIATGMAALALHGVWGLPPEIEPEITLLSRNASNGAPGVRVRQFSKEFDLRRYQGRVIAAPVPALVQALPELGARRGVAVVDSALNKRIIAAEDLSEIRTRLRGKRGVKALGAWWLHVDGRAESPAETFTRLDCREAGLPAPAIQVRIRDAEGRIIARADLGWRGEGGSWLLVEIDGRDYHDHPEALFADRHRQNQIMANGQYRLLRFTGRDVMRGIVAGEIARALANLR